MKTKLVYVVVSDESDSYLEQAIVSAFSARFYNQDAVIELVVDKITANTISGKRELIKKYVSRIIAVESPSQFSKVQRSRYLKTNLRRFVRGDYLFIDTDTIICQSLAEVDKFTFAIGAVYDCNRILHVKEIFTSNFGDYFKGYKGQTNDIESDLYINSGVMYVKDDKRSFSLYDSWFRKWSEFANKGLYVDQIPLCFANKENGYPIQIIDNTWNCQINRRTSIHYINDAKILHYFNGANKSYILAQKSIFESIRQDGVISTIIEDFVTHPRDLYLLSSEEYRFLAKHRIIHNVEQNYRLLYAPIKLYIYILNTFQRLYGIIINLKMGKKHYD